jgi:hypothetical protein
MYGVGRRHFFDPKRPVGSFFKAITLNVRLSWANYCLAPGTSSHSQGSFEMFLNRYSIRRVLRSSATLFLRNSSLLM